DTKGNNANDKLPAHTTISSNNDCSCNDDDTKNYNAKNDNT
ncbi:13060_t:CDS:1, partial [Gigaspora margarita]